MDKINFMIDTLGDAGTPKSDGPTSEDNFLNELFSEIEVPPKTQKRQVHQKENSLLKEVLDGLNWKDQIRKTPNVGKNKTSVKQVTAREEARNILNKSVLTPEFEKLHFVPPFEISEKKLREQRKKEREKTKGKKWYGLPATEMTDEIKNDLEVLQMRSVLDPKHFYKKNDLKVLPKYFQIGKVMDSSVDFYSNRIPKKLRKKTLVEELLADAQFQKYNKRKYKEIIEEKQKTHYKAWKQAKKLKKKK